jgi:(p)ppGpp synthase/HD superfamily hydrolase
VALFVVGTCSTIGGADGFTATQPQHERLSTRRYFVEDTVAFKTQDALTNALQPQSGKLPTWLRKPRAHLYEQNVSNLHDAMLNSFFSENEIVKLVHAIQKASAGDRNKMAQAAEFCLILVETMEIGLSALLAAAFHFCSCVTAREQSLLLPFGASPSGLWEHQEHAGLSSFGEHAVAIARDAASLKRLEMVAAEIMQSPRKSVRVVPDARDSENLQRLLLTESKDWRALAIRSAACLYRMRGIQESLPKGDLSPEAVRVAREAIYIFAPMASRLGMHRLKNELEGTAFKILYRRQYETVTSLSHEFQFKNFGRTMTRPAFSEKRNGDDAMNIGDSMQRVLDDVTEDVRAMLRSDPDFSSMAENVSVTARVKEPYSMWKKMLRDSTDHILQVPDALALRIVFDGKKDSPDEDTELTRAKERALCYYVRELCTNRWKPQPGNPRFKDYIEHPKANGYQSLHYTAITNWGGEDWTMEIQIRSGEMHRVAEYGLASHWDYKANWKKKDESSGEEYFSDAYLRSVQEWHWQQHSGRKQWNAASSTPEPFGDQAEGDIRIRARTEQLAPYIEALSEAQSHMALEHVFVFLSHSQNTMHTEGKVVALPAGACVLDALRHAERTLGLRLNWREERSLVSHNGSMSNLTQKLKNGDILTVPQVQVPMEQRL